MQLLWKLFLNIFLFLYLYFSLSSVCTVLGRPSFFSSRPERRHGSNRVPGHAFFAWRSSWRMVVYIYCITAAGNSNSLQLGSSWQGNRYGTEKSSGMARRSHTKSHLPRPHAGSLLSSQPGGPPCWVSHLAFGLIVLDHGKPSRKWRDILTVTCTYVPVALKDDIFE